MTPPGPAAAESYIGTWLPEPLLNDAGSQSSTSTGKTEPACRQIFARTRRHIAVIALDVLDGQVQAIRTVANPAKLRHLGPVSKTWHLRQEE